jgi:YegS/Rv2252/BmrU family lipid kinase
MPSTLPDDPHYRVIVNPWAGRGAGERLLPRFEELLQGLRYDLVMTEAPKHATALAAAAADEGYDVVVAVGGDGTTLEVLNGLVGRETAIAVLPIGSGNDFLKPLGVPHDLEIAAGRLREGRIRPVDLGRVGDTYFGNGLGVGFGAQVVIESRKMPRMRGFALYLASVCRAVWRYRSPPMVFQFDDQELQGRFLMAAIANGRCYGAGFWLAPDAEMDDGLFDLCLIAHMPIPLFFFHLPKVFKGKHTHIREVTMARARRVVVKASRPVPVHADGEIVSEGATEMEVEIVPQALQVVC